jgi:hypothetical protein
VASPGSFGAVANPRKPLAETWGFGAAPLVQTKANEVVVFASDFHVPYQSTAVVDSLVKLIRSVKPDRVVLNGDVADFFSLSRFNTSSARLGLLQQEIDEANSIRLRIRRAAPNAVLMENQGNHDHRVISYVEQNAKALSSLRALDPENLFQYRALEIVYHPGAGFRLREDFLVKHGTIVRGEAGASAKAEFTAAGISGTSGHVHRLATYRKAGYSDRSWTEGGCCCRLDPDYITGPPNWTQGVVVGEFGKTSWVTHEVPFVDGKLRLGLRKY